MSNNSREYNISNENLLLISILNSMYNDNIRQIDLLYLSNDVIYEHMNAIANINLSHNNDNNNNCRGK